MNDKLTNHDDGVNVFLECAQEIARGIDSLEGRSEIISLVAFKYAEAGQIDFAVDLAEAITDSYIRDQALGGIAARCIEVGAADHADSLSDRIEDDTVYALGIELLAVTYAEHDAFAKSIEVAHKLPESAPALNRIALSCIARGQLNQALEATRSIDYPDLRAPLLIELAAKALQDDRASEALDLLAEATETAEAIEFTDQRISALVAISSLNKRCGEEDEAFKILSAAHHLCNESDFDADAALAEIAAGFAELQRYDHADKVIEEIENPFRFAHATARVALEYHKAGNTAKTLELLADAMEIGRDEEVYGDQSLLMRDSLLRELAGCYALLDHYEEALQITGWMSSQEERYRTLGDIARQCVRSGHHSRVFQVTEMIDDTYTRVLWDLEMVNAFVTSEQLELADHALSETLARAATIRRPYEKAMALMEVADRFARREQSVQASEVLFDSLTTVTLVEDGYHQAQALINLSGKYKKLEQPIGEREQQVVEELSFSLER